MVKIAIRIDDITDNMDWQRFNRFTDILDRYGVCPLIGVIPANEDESIKSELREDYSEWLQVQLEKGWTVAMHGFNHRYVTKKGGVFPLNLFSEYAGISYEKQNQMIAEGKSLLERKGVHADIFMAPAHTFDNNTLKALIENGFKYVTDGFGSMPYIRKGMTFLPIASRKGKDINGADGYTTLVYHVWNMNDKDFELLEKLISERRDQIINYSELLDVSPVKQGSVSRLKEYLTASAKRMLVKLRG